MASPNEGNRPPRHFGTGVLPDAAPPGTIDKLKAENEQQKTKIEQLTDEKCALKKKAARAAYWDNRRLLKRALDTAYRDGLHFYGRGHKRNSDASRWVLRTYKLVEAALGLPKAKYFLTGDENAKTSPPWGEDEERPVDEYLNRLAELQQQVNSVEYLTLQPNFDGRDWVSKW